MSTKFNLSIDLFTPHVHDAVDVARALRDVADRLSKFTSLPWSTYALTGKIFAKGSRHCIGTWSVDSEAEAGLTLTAENDPDSRLHCERCGEHMRPPNAHVCRTRPQPAVKAPA
jgi:hypothetical protein